jgi:hypothetical protein
LSWEEDTGFPFLESEVGFFRGMFGGIKGLTPCSGLLAITLETLFRREAVLEETRGSLDSREYFCYVLLPTAPFI